MIDIFNNQDVCTVILSFLKNEFLFVGTVNSVSHGAYMHSHGCASTSFRAGIDGPSRTEESIESGFRKMVNVYRHAIRLDKMDTVLQLYERRMNIDVRECFVHAILYKRLDVFRWVCSKCDPENTYWFDLAAQFGKIEVLEVLKDSGFVWDAGTTLEAAEFGQTDSLVWLYDNGCPIDERVIVRSAVKGYDDIVAWCSGIIYEPPVPL